MTRVRWKSFGNSHGSYFKKKKIDKNLSRLESSDNQFKINDIKDENTLLDHSDLKVDSKDSDKYKQIDEKIMEDMQRQLNCNGTSFTPESQESIRKLKELFEE